MAWKHHIMAGVDAFEDSFGDLEQGDGVAPSPKLVGDDHARGDARGSGRSSAPTSPSHHARGRQGDVEAGHRGGVGGDRSQPHERSNADWGDTGQHHRDRGYDSPPKSRPSDRPRNASGSPTSPTRKLCFYVGSESSKLPNGFRCHPGTDGCGTKTSYRSDATGCDPSVYKYKCFSGMQFETQSQMVTNGVLMATDKTRCPVWHVDG